MHCNDPLYLSALLSQLSLGNCVHTCTTLEIPLLELTAALSDGCSEISHSYIQCQADTTSNRACAWGTSYTVVGKSTEPLQQVSKERGILVALLLCYSSTLLASPAFLWLRLLL